MNLKIGNTAIGRVYVNEVQDDCVDGARPLATFKKSQAIRVKVIGARMIATTRGYGITNLQKYTSLSKMNY